MTQASNYTEMLSQQSLDLLNEWNAIVTGFLNPDYALSTSRCRQLAEVFNGQIYSRIHRAGDSLILEERQSGSMYPRAFLLEQDFSELEALLEAKPFINQKKSKK